MSNLSSSTLDKVIGNVVEEVMREKEEKGNQEISLKVVLEEIEVVVEEGEAKAFYSNKGEESFKKHLAKKGYVEERGFKQLISPFKEEVERRGWETVKPAHGSRKEGTSQGILRQLGRKERSNVLCQGEMDPFWGNGHLLNLGAHTSGGVCRV